MIFPYAFAGAVYLVILHLSDGHWLSGRDKTQCPTQGLICSQDCKSINFCATEGGDPVQLRQCSDMLCSNATGVPECDAVACHEQGPPKPICGVAGAIPAPSDCHVYYLCGSPGEVAQLEVTCENDQVFDVATSTCKDGGACYEPKTCTKPGDSGTIDNGGVFCYYCNDKNVPFVFKCSDV